MQKIRSAFPSASGISELEYTRLSLQEKCYHYGDIDAGGFQILLHLREKTGIPFIPYQMDIPVLQKYAEYTKPLTSHDRKRMERLADSEFSETIQYMLQHNCKLEQESSIIQA